MTDQAIVRLSNITKSYGYLRAVDNLELDIEPGEFFAMLGPSGCGKTTTLKLISGFTQPDSGDIYIHGEPVTGLPAHKRDVNTVFQDYALFPHLNIVDNVAYGLRMKGVPKAERRAQAADALSLVRLDGVGRRKIHELSGGQQQRVALARAIVNRPSVLLLDEPLGSLDLKLRRAMQHELRALQKELGITFVFVTHDQHEALSMADRIAVMSGGVLAQVGTPQEIYEEPQSRFVAEFIGDSGFLTGELVEIRDRIAGIKLLGGGTVKARLPKGADSSALSSGDRIVVAVRPEHASVEGAEGASGGSDTNRVTGLLQSVEYVGSDSIYVIDAAPAGLLMVRQRGTGPAITVGKEITLTFSPENSVALTDPDPKKSDLDAVGSAESRSATSLG